MAAAHMGNTGSAIGCPDRDRRADARPLVSFYRLRALPHGQFRAHEGRAAELRRHDLGGLIIRILDYGQLRDERRLGSSPVKQQQPTSVQAPAEPERVVADIQVGEQHMGVAADFVIRILD